MDFPSKILENTVNEISKLPSIGKRTALRLALHILKQPENHIDALADSIKNLRKKINFCSECYNLSDNEICEICLNPNRQNGELCVVEDIRDVMAIENTSQFKGRYHVLNGLISPIDGVGPADLKIESLIERIKRGKIKEIIFALSATMEGDTASKGGAVVRAQGNGALWVGDPSGGTRGSGHSAPPLKQIKQNR